MIKTLNKLEIEGFVFGLIKTCDSGPGQVAQLVKASSPNSKVAGSIPGQGTYKEQPLNA